MKNIKKERGKNKRNEIHTEIERERTRTFGYYREKKMEKVTRDEK